MVAQDLFVFFILNLKYTHSATNKSVEPKELIIIPNSVHVDLYDKEDIIPFDNLEQLKKKLNDLT